MNFFEKIQAQQKALTLKAFKAGEEADTLGRKAGKLDRKPDKTKEEEAQTKELRREAERMRAQQAQAKQLGQRMGLGEQILRAYFTYKMASLACHTLVGMTANNHHYYHDNNAVGRAITSGIHDMSNTLADKIVDSTPGEGQEVNEQRAQMIEQTLESFERMSQEAEAQGLTQEGEPLLTDEDREKIQELADISRDSENAQQAERYATKCQELGLDYNEALKAFEQDKSIDTVENEVTKEVQEKEEENTLEYTV